MARMNWQRATERDQDRQRGHAAAPAARTAFKAKYPGTCTTCGDRFAVGDLIASTLDSGRRVFSHQACIYGTPAGPGAAADPAVGLTPNGRCHATTKKGDPCRGGAKRDELYCGPHLDQMTQPSEPSPAEAGGIDPYDEPF